MRDYLLRTTAVLFDSDGVLVESDQTVARAWTRWAHQYELDPLRVAAVVHGRRASDTVDLLLEPALRAAALAAINTYELEDAASVTPIPGAVELIASIPLHACAVVTSATAALAQARLEAAGIARPRVLVTADDISRGKPAPDGYRTAATALGVPPSAAIVVEDSASGVQAGRQAGARWILGVGTRALETDADLVVSDLRGVAWGDGLVVRGQAVLRVSEVLGEF